VAKSNPKHERFVAEFLVDLNAKQAAIRAGYSPRSAEVTGCKLLSNPKVAAAIAEGQKRVLDKLELSAERVLLELSRIAISDIRAVFDERGNLLQINGLPEGIAAAVASVEVVTRSIGEGEVEYVHKIKFWDKLRALELLAKRLGLVKEQHEHSGKNGGPIETRVVFGGRYRPAADRAADRG
jgi:phage terminase small subunit